MNSNLKLSLSPHSPAQLPRSSSVLAPFSAQMVFSLAAPPTSQASPLANSPCMFCRRVAVIGAGAAGLVAARELQREGHAVAVFERGRRIGGTWVYSPSIESDLVGIDPKRKVVHSSLYDSLRTNLPRECMGFFDYPFVAVAGRDSRRFPGHQEVLCYLDDFSREFDVCGLVRFRTEVVCVEMENDCSWAVSSRKVNFGNVCEEREVYDAVVICNGHYTEPRVAEIPGIKAWPGKQIHSHNYRIPQPFLDQVVVVIGSSASAADISLEIAGFAKEVHIADRSASVGTPTKQTGDNVWLHSMIENTFADGTVLFKDGSSVLVDVIIHCTGYKYHFPFLKTNGVIGMDDNRVGPLYKHVFPPTVAPFLSFIGLPWKVIPFPLCELQSKWVAGVLSGRIALPTSKAMMDDVNHFYCEMEQTGWPKRYTHNIADYQFEYDDWLASQCGYPPVEVWRKQMYEASRKNKVTRPDSYRDEWDDDEFIELAYEDFSKLLVSS